VVSARFEAATFLDSGDKALKYLGLLDDGLENVSSTSSESLHQNVISSFFLLHFFCCIYK